jgi:DNA-directed RNA polymerase sigma subunit (sigma70/sigma32)
MLTPENRHVVTRRFGLDGSAPATYAELGEELGVTAEAVRRRVQRALALMRPTAEQCAA